MIYLGFWHIEGEEGENVINIYIYKYRRGGGVPEIIMLLGLETRKINL